MEEIRIENGKVVVTLSGKVYVEQAADIREKLIEQIDHGQTQFEFDLTGVEYIDSSGLGVMVAIHKRALQHGGSVAVRGLQGMVKELFELTRLTKVFEIRE